MSPLARRLAAAALLVGVAGGALPAGAHPSASLELINPSGGRRLRSVKLTVPNGATSASRILFLRRVAGSLSLIDLRLVGEVDGATATLVPLDAPNPLSLGSAPSTVPVRLVVTFESAGFGVVRGRLFAIGASQPVVLATLVASRPRPPGVTVLNTGATGLAVTTRSPALIFRIELQANDAGASDLAIAVSDLRGESGRFQEVTVGKVHPGRLRPGAIARATVTAFLPEPGSYTSAILVTHDGQQAPAVPLVVTRTRAAPTVDMNGTGQIEMVWWPWAKAGVSFTLTESAGDEVTLAPPALVDLGRTDGDVNLQPNETSVEVRLREHGTRRWSPVPSAGIIVSPLHPKDIRFELPGVRTPGVYTATAKIREPGGTSVDKAVKIFVRYPVYLLWLAVVVGIGLSYFVRVLVSHARLRAVLLRRLSQVVVDLDDALGGRSRADDPQVEELVAALMGTEQHLSERVRRRGGKPEDVTTDIDRLERRGAVAPTWVRLHRLIIGLKPPELLGEERGKLNALRATLMDQAAAVEDVGKVGEELRALDAAISTKLSTELQACLAALTAQVEDEGAFFTDTQRASLPDVRERLEEASERLEAGDYAAASKVLASAQERFANLLILDLEAYLRELPDWVGPNRTAIGRNVMAKLRGAARPSERYHAALKELLGQLTQVAKARADRIADTTVQGAVMQLLNAIQLSLDHDELRKARDLLTEAVQQAGDFAGKPFRSVDEVRGQRAVPSGVDLPTRIFVPAVADLQARATAARADLGALAKRERTLSKLSLLVASVVALTLATVILYDRSWGSPQDIATAILWGLGIQAGASFTFLGIDQLQRQLEGTTPARTA